MNTQTRQSNQHVEINEPRPLPKVARADWTESLECLLLLALVAAVAVSFAWTADSSMHTLWSRVMTQMHVALTQAHIT